MRLTINSFNKTTLLLIASVLLSLLSCNSKSGTVEANPDSAQTGESAIVDGISVKAWKGNGSGGEDKAKSLEKGIPVYMANGDANEASQTVIANLNPSQILQDGNYYELTTEVLSQGITKHFDFIAAIRSGKTKDVYEVYDNADSWRKITLLIKPTATSRPKYVAVRLYGPGTIWVTPFKFREIDKAEYESLTNKLKVEENNDTQRRIEKVMRKVPATLPHVAKDAPRLFKSWAAFEDQYMPPPQGWKQVPGERTEITPEISEKLNKADYIVYTRNEATPIFLESIPKATEVTDKITASATRGEYEPLNFAIYSGKNLEGIKIKVSDLKSDKGSRISSANIDIRTVNFVRKIKDQGKKTYFLMPMTLSKGHNFIDTKTSRRYWLTVHVPKNANTGTYTGEIEIHADNVQTKKVTIIFEVLPYELLDPPIVRFMWSPKVNFPDNDEKMYHDLREHGMTTMMLGGEVKTRDRKVDQQDIDYMVESISNGVEMHRKLRFRDNPIGGISNNQIINYWDKSINWFRFWPITKELDNEFISAYRRIFLENKESKNWPEIYHYIVDEPGGANPKNLEPTAHYLKLFKKNLPELKTFVTIGGGMKQGYDELGMLSPYLDVTATNYVNNDLVNRLGKLGSAFWVYNGSSLNAEPIKERFFFGWYAWKVGAKGIGQWTYAWTGSPYSEAFRDNRQDYALETMDGFIPTVGWELIREGVDDYKYIYTLSRLIQLGLKSDNKAFRRQAEESNKFIIGLRGKININYQRGSDVPESSVVGISPGDLTSYRKNLDINIQKLINVSRQSWPTLKSKLSAAKDLKPQTLTENDWKSLASSQSAGGKDMLSDSKFGGFLSDWKFQVWKGKGGGDFSTNVTFGKSKAAKLFIDSDAKGDNAVLVLHKPNVILKHDVKYRLSAWVKAENVTQYAALYAAVRGGGISDSMSAKVQGTSEWREIWTEFTPEEDTAVQYLALRLWGNGTVYTDKIKLQAM